MKDHWVPITRAQIIRQALSDAGCEESEDVEFERHGFGKKRYGSTDEQQKLGTFQLFHNFLKRRARTQNTKLGNTVTDE